MYGELGEVPGQRAGVVGSASDVPPQLLENLSSSPAAAAAQASQQLCCLVIHDGMSAVYTLTALLAGKHAQRAAAQKDSNACNNVYPCQLG
jgi:hypothetical protein